MHVTEIRKVDTREMKVREVKIDEAKINLSTKINNFVSRYRPFFNFLQFSRFKTRYFQFIRVY